MSRLKLLMYCGLHVYVNVFMFMFLLDFTHPLFFSCVQLKPVPQSRVIVSARFLKPIKEPCAIL